MSYLIIILFALNGQMESLYMGETTSQKDCAVYARENFPKVYPTIKEAIILCVKKESA